MDQEQLAQVKQDMEHLVADVKKLMGGDEKPCCTSEDGKIACHLKSGCHTKAWVCLGLTALVAGIAGAVMLRKQSSQGIDTRIIDYCKGAQSYEITHEK